MAGRKSLKDEALMAEVINMSWLTIRGVLTSPEVPQSRKEEIALKIVEKSVPKDINLGSQAENPLGVTIQVVRDKAGTNSETDSGV